MVSIELAVLPPLDRRCWSSWCFELTGLSPIPPASGNTRGWLALTGDVTGERREDEEGMVSWVLMVARRFRCELVGERAAEGRRSEGSSSLGRSITPRYLNAAHKQKTRCK